MVAMEVERPRRSDDGGDDSGYEELGEGRTNARNDSLAMIGW